MRSGDRRGRGPMTSPFRLAAQRRRRPRRGGRGLPAADRGRGDCTRPTCACDSRRGSTAICSTCSRARCRPPGRASARCVDGVVSLSPERFLRRQGREVWTEPIKGTRPRVGSDGSREAARARAAAGSEKDAAEHVMIVDLMRNDLGRVCAYGTVRAEAPRVEPHAGVWHLVSTVARAAARRRGRRRAAACELPARVGDRRAEGPGDEGDRELEATRRELYTGAIGIASPLAGLDLSVVIRTFEVSGDAIWLGAGGAIVADSEPEQELAEAFTRRPGPIAAIGGELITSRRIVPAGAAPPQGSPGARCFTETDPIRRSAYSRPCSSWTGSRSPSSSISSGWPRRLPSCTVPRSRRR